METGELLPVVTIVTFETKEFLPTPGRGTIPHSRSRAEAATAEDNDRMRNHRSHSGNGDGCCFADRPL